MDKKLQKALALAGTGIIIAGAAFGAGGLMNPQEVVVEKIVKVPSEPIIKTVEVPVEVEKIVEKPVEVLVDNGNLQLLLDEAVEHDGDLEWLVDGLDEYETELIVERLLLSHEWDRKAIDYVKAELADELDKETVNGTELDEDEIRSIRIDIEDVEFADVDWDDKDADISVPFSFRHDDEKFEGVAIVEIREGVADELIIDSISKE